MKDVLKSVAPMLRALGFRGSGQNYRKHEGDFVFVVNFQGSRAGDRFYVNLGAQPVFIPAEGEADLRKLKEYQCVFRRRVGTDWPWAMSGQQILSLQNEITTTQAAFFGQVQTLKEALTINAPDDLLRNFSISKTEARAALHLARAAARLGHIETARKLVNLGLELAGERATILVAELHRVLDDPAPELPNRRCT